MIEKSQNIAINPNYYNKPQPKDKTNSSNPQMTEDGWLDIKPRKINLKDEAVGLFAGISTFFGVKKIIKIFTRKIVEDVMEKAGKIPDKKSLEIAEDMLKDFKEKGLKYELITEANAAQYKKQLLNDLRESKLAKSFYKVGIGQILEKLFWKRQLEKAIEATLKAENAFYFNISNIAFAPKNKPGLLLHELGHAINFNNARFKTLKSIGYGLPIGVLTALAMYPIDRLSYERSKKNYLKSEVKFKNEYEKSKKRILEKNGSQKDFDKVKQKYEASRKILNATMKYSLKIEKFENWIKDNIGKIILISFIPMLIEEGSASLKGIKAASKRLNPEELKMLKKSYGSAFTTYCIAAVVASFAAKFAVYVRDRIVRDNK